MVPMREAGYEDALEVGHDRVERLAALGRVVGERLADVARLHARENGIALAVFEVVGNRKILHGRVIGNTSNQSLPNMLRKFPT